MPAISPILGAIPTPHCVHVVLVARAMYLGYRTAPHCELWHHCFCSVMVVCCSAESRASAFSLTAFAVRGQPHASVYPYKAGFGSAIS